MKLQRRRKAYLTRIFQTSQDTQEASQHNKCCPHKKKKKPEKLPLAWQEIISDLILTKWKENSAPICE